MRKRFLTTTTLVALVGLMAGLAATAQATPSKTSLCSNCHDGATVGVTTTLVSTVGTTARYDVSAPGADAVAVFDGSVKLSTINASTGQFTVPTGKTYTVFAVAGPGTSDGIGRTTVSPVATPVDTTAPVTVSDAQASYVSSALIKLSATDAGSGVANTYYILDGAAQVAGTGVNVTAPGAHTISFWSVDAAGNIEARKTASFTITVPAPVDTTAPVTVSDAQASYVSSALIKLSATDAGSGVANTYYILDGAAQVAGTGVNVTAPGAHTISFWSVDAAGNIEARKTASFTITVPAPEPQPEPTPETTATVTTRVSGRHAIGATATLTNTATGETFTAIVGAKGRVTFANVPVGTYSLSYTSKTGEKYVRTISVRDVAAQRDRDSRDSRHRHERFERLERDERH